MIRLTKEQQEAELQDLADLADWVAAGVSPPERWTVDASRIQCE